MARQGDEPEGREDGGEGEQQRDARGHERTERDDEDDQRERDGEESRALQVVRKSRVDGFCGARAAELADEEARMRPLRLVDALEYGAEPVAGRVLVASDLELDERRVLVLGNRRRPDVLHCRRLRNAGDDVLDRSIEGRRSRSS